MKRSRESAYVSHHRVSVRSAFGRQRFDGDIHAGRLKEGEQQCKIIANASAEKTDHRKGARDTKEGREREKMGEEKGEKRGQKGRNERRRKGEKREGIREKEGQKWRKREA